jgi:hypothetical protein
MIRPDSELARLERPLFRFPKSVKLRRQVQEARWAEERRRKHARAAVMKRIQARLADADLDYLHYLAELLEAAP